MNKKKSQLFKPINLVSEAKLKKKKLPYLFHQMYVSFKRMRSGPGTLRCGLPAPLHHQIANCQINSVFHLAKRTSEFLSHICEDGWKCSHSSHSDLQQKLDFVARRKVLNAGYSRQSPMLPSWCQFSSWNRHRDPRICFNLETKDFCRMIPTLCT